MFPETHNADTYAFLDEEEADWRAFNPYGSHNNSEDEDNLETPTSLDEEEEDWRAFNPYGSHNASENDLNRVQEQQAAHINTHPILDGTISFLDHHLPFLLISSSRNTMRQGRI